jgi:hypothetical protein
VSVTWSASPPGQAAASSRRVHHGRGLRLRAEVLAAALSVYATTLALGGPAAQAPGFTVTAAGLGARSFGVGSHGAAFGVANHTRLNVYQLLQAVDRRAVRGVPYGGRPGPQQQAHQVFAALLAEGAVGG